MQPPPGKALIYLLDADPDRWSLTMHICVDDRWAGAVRGRSGFPLVLDPGAHEISTAIQRWSHHPGAVVHVTPVASLAITLIAGQTAFVAVAVRKEGLPGDSPEFRAIARIWKTNPDEGRLLLASEGKANPSGPALAAAESACGPPAAHFQVSWAKKAKAAFLTGVPQGNASVVYVIGDDVSGRVGMDGRWVGAVKWNSWLSIPVQPGIHHFCFARQRRADPNHVALNIVQAQPAGAYYLVATTLSQLGILPSAFSLNDIPPNEATARFARCRLSMWKESPLDSR